MLGRKVVKRPQRLPILGQAGSGAGVLGPVFLDEDGASDASAAGRRRAVDLAQVRLPRGWMDFRTCLGSGCRSAGTVLRG